MNSSVPRVGLVGLGGYGEQHLRLLNTLEGAGLCRLASAADPFLERHELLVRALRSRGASVHQRWEDLLAGDEVEAVFLATPIHWHARQATAALRAGKSVYLEKPPCATLGEWEQMMAAQRQSGKICAVGFQMQCSGALRFLKSQLEAGAIGPLRQDGAPCDGGAAMRTTRAPTGPRAGSWMAGPSSMGRRPMLWPMPSSPCSRWPLMANRLRWRAFAAP